MAGPNEIDAYIGARIRRIREYRGVVRDVLAVALGMTSTDVGILERGLKRLSPEQVFAVAGVLKIKPSFLFSGLSLRVDEEYASALIPYYEDMKHHLPSAQRN